MNEFLIIHQQTDILFSLNNPNEQKTQKLLGLCAGIRQFTQSVGATHHPDMIRGKCKTIYLYQPELEYTLIMASFE